MNETDAPDLRALAQEYIDFREAFMRVGLKNETLTKAHDNARAALRSALKQRDGVIVCERECVLVDSQGWIGVYPRLA